MRGTMLLRSSEEHHNKPSRVISGRASRLDTCIKLICYDESCQGEQLTTRSYIEEPWIRRAPSSMGIGSTSPTRYNQYYYERPRRQGACTPLDAPSWTQACGLQRWQWLLLREGTVVDRPIPLLAPVTGITRQTRQDLFCLHTKRVHSPNQGAGRGTWLSTHLSIFTQRIELSCQNMPDQKIQKMWQLMVHICCYQLGR